jgi:hypothetical protein
MTTRRVGLLPLVALTATLCLASRHAIAGQPGLSGSEAVRAEKCAGDYACDEDGSWSPAYGCTGSRLAPSAGTADRTPQQPTRASGECEPVRWQPTTHANADRPS